MQRFKQGQKLIIILLSFALTLLAVFSCFNFAIKNRKVSLAQTEDEALSQLQQINEERYADLTIEGVSGYNFNYGIPSDESYKSSGYFIIENIVGFKNFIESVNNGLEFTHKVVIL